MAAKTNAEYKREQRERAAKRGTKPLALPVTPGMQVIIDELCERYQFEDWRELVFTVLRNCHSDAASGALVTVIPKAGFEPTPAQLRALSSYVAPNEDE